MVRSMQKCCIHPLQAAAATEAQEQPQRPRLRRRWWHLTGVEALAVPPAQVLRDLGHHNPSTAPRVPAPALALAAAASACA